MFTRVVCFHSSIHHYLNVHSTILFTTANNSLRIAMNVKTPSAARFDCHTRGSFGGKDRSKSAFNANQSDYHTIQRLQSTRNLPADVEKSKDELSRSALSASSSSLHPDPIPGASFDSVVGTASGLQRQEEFPELIRPNTSSSSSSILMDSNVPPMPQQQHSLKSASNDIDAIRIGQTEDATGFSGQYQISSDSSRHKMQTSINQGTSQNMHMQAGGDDDWEPQPRRGQRTSSKEKSKKSFRESLKSGNSSTVSETGNYVDKDRIYYLGRLMTSILRHRAAQFNLTVRNDGYVAVKDLLKLGHKTQAGLPLSIYTVDDVCKAVERDNKQRFGLLMENGVLLVRANQGHSMKVVETDKLLKLITSADEISVCVHGTFMKNIDSILKTGLSKMRRNHVHFASGLPHEDGIISGMKSHCEVLIYLDVEKALQDGMKLYLSENGVILTEGFDGSVPRKYFSQIAKWKKGKIIPMVADL